MSSVLVRVLLQGTDTKTKAGLNKTTFNWGWLTDSEVQSIISMAAYRQAWPGAAESSTS